MYPKKVESVSLKDKRENEKIQRREQLKNLIVNKFKSKYAYSSADIEARENYILREVDSLMQNQQWNEKNLVELDKKLLEKYGTSPQWKTSQPLNSRKNSNPSWKSNKPTSELSNRNTMIRAGLNISSQERPAGTSSNGDHRDLGSFRSKDLNRSQVSRRPVDEWDNIVLKDVRRFEEEQKVSILKKQQMKRKVMEDLNTQLQEKRKISKREEELEKELDKQREFVKRNEERRAKEQDLKKTRKNQEERRIMETQIAELERMKKFEKDKDKSQAFMEKEQVEKALQDELKREYKKRQEYHDTCKKQYTENIQLKENVKKQEGIKAKEENEPK